MKRLVAAVAAGMLACTTQAPPVKEIAGHGEFTFGMTQKEAIAASKTRLSCDPSDADPQESSCISDGNLTRDRERMGLLLQFRADRLHDIMIMFTYGIDEEEAVRKKFERIARELKTQYGAPIVDREASFEDIVVRDGSRMLTWGSPRHRSAVLSIGKGSRRDVVVQLHLEDGRPGRPAANSGQEKRG